ncbi:uncharacterized protein [Primulina eburnea]|uniref:uncharacterized protein n=1 Tax=Primulina eburnea TaxID=1245227 RepID=UPI003C6C646B
MRGVIRFDKTKKFNTRYVGPFEILKKVGGLAYQLSLPPNLSRIHAVFHVSQLRRYIFDPSFVLEMRTLVVQDIMKETYSTEVTSIHIVNTTDRVLTQRSMPYVKVQWSNHMKHEATWEVEDMRKRYSYLLKQQEESSYEDESFHKEEYENPNFDRLPISAN